MNLHICNTWRVLETATICIRSAWPSAKEPRGYYINISSRSQWLNDIMCKKNPMRTCNFFPLKGRQWHATQRLSTSPDLDQPVNVLINGGVIQMNMNTCFLNVPEQGLHDDDIQYPERSMLLELRGSFVSVQLRTGSAKARATTPKHTHTHNYTARWQAGRSGSTTLLRNRIKLSAFHSYAALYCMHWISPLFTNASKLRKRRVGKDWKCWAETCRAKPHVVAEHACTKGRITYRSIHAYNFSSTFFGCEWKASSCWILYILYSTSNKANIHMHAHGTMSFLPILSLAS